LKEEKPIDKSENIIIINKKDKRGFVNMKRFLLIGCLVLLIVSFIGCGKAPEAEEVSEQPSAEMTSEDTVAVEDTIAVEESDTMDTTAVETSEEQPAEETEE